MHAARHQVVARAFGGGLGQHRRLDVDEAVLHRGNAAPPSPPGSAAAGSSASAAGAGRDSGIRGAPFPTDFRRPSGTAASARVENFDRTRQHFDFAADEVRIDRACGAAAHRPVTFTTNSLRSFSAVAKVAGVVGIAHDLHQAFAVAQIDEDHAAMIAAAVHPAVQRDGLVQMPGGTRPQYSVRIKYQNRGWMFQVLVETVRAGAHGKRHNDPASVCGAVLPPAAPRPSR